MSRGPADHTDGLESRFLEVGIYGTAILLIIAFFVSCHRKVVYERTLEDALKLSLRTQADVQEELFGDPVFVTFYPGEQANLATARWRGRDVKQDLDYNKSRIIGEWAGDRGRELAEGFMDGLRRKPKHQDPQEGGGDE